MPVIDWLARKLLGAFGPQNASIENPAVSLSDPDAWDDLFGDRYDNHADLPIDHAKALEYSPVWQAVTMISGDLAKLPLERFARLPGGGREPDRLDPTYRLVRYQANAEISAFRLWRRAWVHALLWQNGYIFADRSFSGRLLGLYNLLPDRTAPVRIDGQLYFVTEVNKTPYVLNSWDVLHIEGISDNNLCGIDTVKAARNSWALGLAQEKFASKFFANGARASGILEIPAGMNKPAADRLEKGFEDKLANPDKAFKTLVLREGAKFHSITISPDEGQLVDSRREQVREVARRFNIHPSKLGEESSSSYNSKAEDNRAYYDQTLSPWLCDLVGECWVKLLRPEEQAANSHFYEHNTAALLAMDPKSRFEAYHHAIADGILAPDEARAKENMPPRPDGLGGRYIIPANMIYADAAPAAGEPVPSDPPEPANRQQRLLAAHRQLLADAAGRMFCRLAGQAERAATDRRKFGRWLDAAADDNREVITAVIAPAAVAAAAVTGGEPRTDELVACLLARALDPLVELSGQVNEDQLAPAVARQVATLDERAAGELADLLIAAATHYAPA